MEEDGKILENRYVVVQKVGGEQFRVIKFTKKQKILIEKLRFECDGCIGQPYGMFEVSSMKASPITAEQHMEEMRQELLGENQVIVKNGSSTEEGTIDKTSDSDSKDLVEAEEIEIEVVNAAQAGQVLTQDEVLEMKSGGTSAKDLVDKLVQGNKSFVNRTDYAQHKYIRRKMKKHSDRVLVMKPTIRLLANAYYTKDTDKFGMLRVDQLGLLLQMGHVVHNRNVLVIDQLLGIVAAAILERLSGNGSCIHAHRGLIAQSVPCIHSMNFDEEILASYLPVRIRKLLGKGDSASNGQDETMDAAENDNPASSTSIDDANVKRAERLVREQRGIGFVAAGVDSLVIACRSIEVTDILKLLYPKLKAAGAVSIYHPDLQTLLRAQTWLMDSHCLNISLSEQMYRTHQVLPDRTHPLMTQHIAGGYILSGIKVLPPS